jgi:hypothetical protein
MEIVKSKSGNFLVHAVFLVICTLRGHRGGRDVGDHVVFVADEGLRVEAEGVAHEFGDSVCVSTDPFREGQDNLPPDNNFVKHRTP